MLDWLRSHDVLLGWLGAASVAMFVGTLIVVPWLVVRIPADYFVRRQAAHEHRKDWHPWLRIGLLVVKNLCGVALVLAGIAMLLLPGQGILTILIGLTLLDFPGKFALEQKLARQPAVFGAMNWIRAKAGRPSLAAPPPPQVSSSGAHHAD